MSRPTILITDSPFVAANNLHLSFNSSFIMEISFPPPILNNSFCSEIINWNAHKLLSCFDSSYFVSPSLSAEFVISILLRRKVKLREIKVSVNSVCNSKCVRHRRYDFKTKVFVIIAGCFTPCDFFFLF